MKLRAIRGVIWKLSTVEVLKNVYTYKDNLNEIAK